MYKKSGRKIAVIKRRLMWGSVFAFIFSILSFIFVNPPNTYAPEMPFLFKKILISLSTAYGILTLVVGFLTVRNFLSKFTKYIPSPPTDEEYEYERQERQERYLRAGRSYVPPDALGGGAIERSGCFIVVSLLFFMIAGFLASLVGFFITPYYIYVVAMDAKKHSHVPDENNE